MSNLGNFTEYYKFKRHLIFFSVLLSLALLIKKAQAHVEVHGEATWQLEQEYDSMNYEQAQRLAEDQYFKKLEGGKLTEEEEEAYHRRRVEEERNKCN